MKYSRRKHKSINFTVIPVKVYKEIVAALRQNYFKNATIDTNVVLPYLDLLSDLNFAYGINKAATRHAVKSAAKSHYFRIQSTYERIISTPDDPLSKVTLNAIININRVITNYAKYGTPNPSNENGFLPIRNAKQVNFLDITNFGLIPGVNPNYDTYKLWRRIEHVVCEISPLF